MCSALLKETPLFVGPSYVTNYSLSIRGSYKPVSNLVKTLKVSKPELRPVPPRQYYLSSQTTLPAVLSFKQLSFSELVTFYFGRNQILLFQELK